jgi:creatinine amidohydrolase
VVKDIGALASPDVAAHLERCPIVVIPFGSIEQHGPHLPCATDTIIAERVAQDVAERLDALLVPFCPYGVTPIHAGHPGTVNLGRGTFEALLRDICEEMVRMRARSFVFVNWHEGNTASLDAVATDLQDRHGHPCVVAQACYVALRLFEEQGGELTHGGGIETLGVMAQDPGLVRMERVAEPTRPPGANELDAMRRSREVYGFITDVTELATDGWYGEPQWALDQDPSEFIERVGREVTRRVQEVLRSRGADLGG